jgi:ATP-binding cassette subfamily F protein 3
MPRLEKAGLYRGGRDLFHDLDWILDPRDRVGLVGANGVGKTSLLRVMAGEIPPDHGEVARARGERVGYLPQEGLLHAGRNLYQEALEGMATLRDLQREIERSLLDLERLPHDDPRHEEALRRHEGAEASFRALGGYGIEGRVTQVLRGLGFAQEDLGRDCSEFSGGWQMRIALAKLLLESPEVLLLDEPTNHLDIEARIWLEHFLENYPGAVVVVSHDRTFVDRVAHRVCELTDATLTFYPGGFTRYLADRQTRREQLLKAAAEQEQEIQRIGLFIRRYQADKARAAQVQSRMKMLEKIEPIVVPPSQERIRFEFLDPPKVGLCPIILREVAKRYGERLVLDGVDLTVNRGERICLAGPNGAGKSTLLRLLAGRERLTAGSRELDPRTRIGYFAQDQAEDLAEEATVLESTWELTPRAPETQVRTLLGAFLFRDEAVFKRCSVLSGGERSRVALARNLLQEANVLLLDEPTNHLDLQGKESLLEALQHFQGSVVFVSHDRDFTDALATTTVEVGGGRAVRYELGFDDFLWKRAYELGFEGERVPGVPAPDLWFLRGTEFFETKAGEAPALERAEAAEAKSRFEDRRKLLRRADTLKRRIAELEEESAAASARMAELDQRMAAPDLAADHAALWDIQQQKDTLTGENERRAEEWERALTELEEIEGQIER